MDPIPADGSIYIVSDRTRGRHMRSSIYRPFGWAFLLGIIGVASIGSASRAQEKVEYRKADKKTDFTGSIVEENPGIIKVKPGIGTDLSIPTASIIRVTYTAPSLAIKAELDGAVQLGEKKDYTKAIEAYGAVLKKVTDVKSLGMKRDIEYRIAVLKGDASEGVADRVRDAIETMDKFLKDNPTSWQYGPVARYAARLQTDSGKVEDARKTLEGLSAAMPKEYRGEVDTAVVDLLMRTGKFDEAKGKIAQALAILPPTDPNRERMRVCQIGLKALDTAAKMEELSKELVGEADKSASVSIKATAYLTLGDCFAFRKLQRDAMWQYLMVDAVFNADRVEQLRAMERLEVLFRDVDPIKDENRAKVYKDRIGRMR